MIHNVKDKCHISLHSRLLIRRLLLGNFKNICLIRSYKAQSS